ncbi:cytochrome c oxidase assembly protein [Paenarthrobacter sp. DKR-5]|uniref:cytochrome c oxidase assembly protein n=1 Tax=Paenarthrobacter sp. DKR-5 TaxID=2835535 RepID=UPI001BDC3050|nr:cytochrome c oxidase assembly protein [Paenarthrobacter sp. DKR-5]MBT1002994.1 cytochrome c oxidase assembly protein [Paenarthrobacter sp. DKR-5]
MPPISVVFSSWTFDGTALCLILASAVLYGAGLRAARRRGRHWPLWRSAAFYVLGLGSLAWLAFGFPGAFSAQLRWAFALKISLLLFVVPLLVGLGRPISLARAALPERGTARLDAVLSSRPVRLASNSFVAPLLGLALFSTFLTPAFYTLRTNPLAEAVLTVAVPLLGLLFALPIIEEGDFARSSALITLEFVYVFIELLADAVPGILLRLNGHVLDGAGPVANGLAWFPSPLRDQQLAGDLLWFICEAVDLPLIILMFMRFSRSDKREARSFDELSDEEMDALADEHLRRRG